MRGRRLRAWWLAAWLLVSPGLLKRDQRREAAGARGQLGSVASVRMQLPFLLLGCSVRERTPLLLLHKNLTMLSSSSLCPLLPTLSAPWRRQTAARAKQTRLIGTQTPLIKCWLCLGCFVIIRAVFINRGSHSNFLADSCHSLRRLRECQRIAFFWDVLHMAMMLVDASRLPAQFGGDALSSK